MKYKFVNVQKIKKDYPNAFQLPTSDELKNIEPGDYIKMSNGKERFWAEIIYNDDDKIKGIIKNELLDNSLYNYGSEIDFRYSNIYQIIKKKDVKEN